MHRLKHLLTLLVFVAAFPAFAAPADQDFQAVGTSIYGSSVTVSGVTYNRVSGGSTASNNTIATDDDYGGTIDSYFVIHNANAADRLFIFNTNNEVFYAGQPGNGAADFRISS